MRVWPRSHEAGAGERESGPAGWREAQADTGSEAGAGLFCWGRGPWREGDLIGLEHRCDLLQRVPPRAGSQRRVSLGRRSPGSPPPGVRLPRKSAQHGDTWRAPGDGSYELEA